MQYMITTRYMITTAPNLLYLNCYCITVDRDNSLNMYISEFSVHELKYGEDPRYREPHFCAFGFISDGSHVRILLSSFGTKSMFLFDADDLAVIHELPLRVDHPRGMATQGSRAWVTCGHVIVYELEVAPRMD
jgi:hypothetical protein